LIIPLYLLLFASTYFLMERASAANFTQSLTRTDALYFSVTVFTTVGFGDIAARSETARVLLIIQMLADLALLGAAQLSGYSARPSAVGGTGDRVYARGRPPWPPQGPVRSGEPFPHELQRPGPLDRLLFMR
jgi:Ion channel